MKNYERRWISEQLCISEASFTCNLYCKYCHNPPSGVRNTIEEIIEKVKEEKPYAVSLEGRGEPLTNPDIVSLIKELKKMGVNNISISTNAIALSNEKLLVNIADDVDFFIINFPSHIKEVYNSITRSVKYDLAIKALENIKKNGILGKVRIFHIINKENYKFLGQFTDWVNKNYSLVLLLNFCFVRNKGRVNNSKEIVPRYTEVSKYLKLALAKAKLYGIKAVMQNIPLCVMEKFEGFSFEFHRWKRGDKVFEKGVEAPLKLEKCLKCSLRQGCCGARRDYIRIYGSSEIKSSKIDLNLIKPERF
ncbi:MAG: radical SAM protein [Elusimicrobiota bacterium]